MYGTYVLENGLGFGFGFLASSGRPLTPLAAHPVYGAGLEIPEAPRGSGILTTTGFRKRSDFLTQVDLHVDYLFPFGDPVRLTIVADFFNLINQQDVLDYNEGTELVFSVIDPDFGQPRQYGTPFAARFGVRLEF